jgi:hypothetical protein
LKSCYQLILDVRTSAHLCPSRLARTSLFVVLLVFIRKPETVQTVKLTLHHRPKPRSASYVQLFVHRNEPNRPHISSDTIDFK